MSEFMDLLAAWASGWVCFTVSSLTTLVVKWMTAMRSFSSMLWRMVSAALRAMATRLPSAMEPEASSTSVTFRGASPVVSGALVVMRATLRSPPSGWG